MRHQRFAPLVVLRAAGAIAVLSMAGAAASAVAAAAAAPESVAAQLRDAAMAGHDIAYSWVSELTTRFGPRPAGSSSEQQAAEWAAARFKALGFENGHIESFPLTAWVRGGGRRAAAPRPPCSRSPSRHSASLRRRPPPDSRAKWSSSRPWTI